MGRMAKDHDPPAAISARLVSLSADSADPPGINDYDGIAEGYAASNETGFVHAYYERPAMLALAGDVAGCGFSTLAAAPALCWRRWATGAPSWPASTRAPGCWR